jgi:hypothetical protein
MRRSIDSQDRSHLIFPFASSLIAVVAMMLVLRGYGRVWWCKYGDLRIFTSEAWNSPHTSQHLFDPYTFTHVLHGVLFFWLTVLIFRRPSNAWRFFVAILVESGWEVFENSTYIIEKYRANTISLDYFGDSVLNSVGDVLACGVGFWIAVKLGWWRSLGFFILVEAVLLMWIRDSLLLNVVMLIYSSDTIKDWQMGT